MNNNQGHGNGARGQEARRAKVKALIVARCARRLEALASQLARARARRQEAFEGREVTEATIEEMTGIYHAASVAAYAATGRVIQPRALFARRKKGGVNPYPFRVRLAWVRAIWKAGKVAKAECYQAARIEAEAASMTDLRALEAHFRGEDKTRNAVALQWAGHGATRDRGALPVSARQVRHARECLIAFWGLSGSNRWAWALRGDLVLLAKCVRVARGEGFAVWGDYETFRNSQPMHAIRRLLQRIGAGDVLMTSQPEASEQAVTAWPRVKRASLIVAKS